VIIEPAWVRPEERFVQVSLEMARALGWDRAAIVARLAFRTNARSVEAVFIDGYLWWRASLEDLGDELGFSKSQVQRHVTALVSDGTIVREKHRVDGAYDQTYSYRINHGEAPTSAESAKLQNRNIDVAEVDDVDVANSQHLPLDQEVKETPQPPKGGVVDSADAEEHHPLFEQFWSEYPKKVDRDAALTEWFRRSRTVQGFSPSAVIAAARAYAEYHRTRGTDPQYVSNPANWLRNGGFRNDLPEPPKSPYQRLN